MKREALQRQQGDKIEEAALGNPLEYEHQKRIRQVRLPPLAMAHRGRNTHGRSRLERMHQQIHCRCRELWTSSITTVGDETRYLNHAFNLEEAIS